MLRSYRSLLLGFAVALLAGGCAATKVAVPQASEPEHRIVERPVFPASESLVVAETPPPVPVPLPAPEQARTEDAQATGSPACEEQQSLVQIERYLRLPAVSHVDRRMTVYGEKLSRWETLAEQILDLDLQDKRPAKWADCFADVNNLFQGYSRLLEEVLKQDLPTVREEELSVDPWQLYFDDIAYLEGGCEQVFLNASALLTGWENRYTPAGALDSESIVGQYVEKGLNEEAILAFQSLQSVYPDREVNVETRKMYGLALLRTGQLDKAGRELGKVLEAMPPSPERRSLRRLVADLLLASGQLEEAYANYRMLAEYYESGKGDDRWVADQLALLGLQDLQDSPGLLLYLDVLQDFIRFNGRTIPAGMKEKVERLEENYPASPLTVRARQMFGQIEDSLREWLRSELDQVDIYLAGHDYDQAKALLEGLLVADLEAPARGLAQQAMDNVVKEERQYILEQRLLEAQTQAEKWDGAVTLLDSGKFDEAIAEFSELFNTDYDVPAREKIREAMETNAARLRREAAGLFVKARKTSDYDDKMKYLEESWSLLNKVVTDYPEVGIIDKVRQNLVLIEQQIEQLNPQLLRNLKPESAPESGSENVIVAPSADFR